MKHYSDPQWQNSMSITFDYNGMMSNRIGEHGINPEDIKALQPDIDRALNAMREKRDAMRWRDLPNSSSALVEEIRSVAHRISKQAEAFVVLGIGGSALGPMALNCALSPMRYNELPYEKRNAPRLYVEDNIDPERFQSLFDVISPENTVFNVITKSGGTSETMSQLILITDILKRTLGDKFADNLIATTDRTKGNLIKIAEEFSLRTFFIPEGVGGRFSVLSPVGLLPAAVCGIDIEELLAGAQYMSIITEKDNISENPALAFAVMQVLAMKRGVNISVCMPYADSLRLMSDWYAQLWAESLGKRVDNNGKTIHSGQTPVKALGVTDQHSQVQLYTEGPFDKCVTFLGVKEYKTIVPIPYAYENLPDVSFLCGHTLNELILAEQFATEYAVAKSGHMSNSITLPKVNAFTIGQLIYMLEMATAFAGELLNINAFDQPGVEEGKNATYALLKKPGYDKKREELETAAPKDPRYIITGGHPVD